MRHWIAEVLAFEPAFNRAMRSLQPLAELGNLRHLSASELRQVIHGIESQRTSQWTSSPAVEPAADDGSASSVPVAESARAD